MLADQIMNLRKKSGMSQLQLADLLRISPSAVGMYEQGRRTPSVDTLILMAALFEVSLDYLITGRESHHCRIIDEEMAEQIGKCPYKKCSLYQSKVVLKKE